MTMHLKVISLLGMRSCEFHVSVHVCVIATIYSSTECIRHHLWLTCRGSSDTGRIWSKMSGYCVNDNQTSLYICFTITINLCLRQMQTHTVLLALPWLKHQILWMNAAHGGTDLPQNILCKLKPCFKWRCPLEGSTHNSHDTKDKYGVTLIVKIRHQKQWQCSISMSVAAHVTQIQVIANMVGDLAFQTSHCIPLWHADVWRDDKTYHISQGTCTAQ